MYQRHAHHAYCDESSTHGVRYVVYGGIVLLEATLLSVDHYLARWRKYHGISAEIAWTSVTPFAYAAYRDVVDEAFERTRND